MTIRFRTAQKRYAASDVAIDNFALTATVADVPPVASNIAASSPQGGSVSITLSALDTNGDPLTYSVVTPPSNGTLSGRAPNLTFTANAGFFGTDTFTYVANDGEFDSAPATVSITVDAPFRSFSTNFGNAADADVDAGDMNAVSTGDGFWTVDFGSVRSEFVSNVRGSDYALVLDSNGQGNANGNHATLQLDPFAVFSSPTTVSFDFTKARSGNPKKMAITGYGPDGSSIAFQLQLDFAGAGSIQVLTDAGLQNLFEDTTPPFASATAPYDPSLLRHFAIILDDTSVTYEGEDFAGLDLTTIVGTIPNSQTALGSITWELTGATNAAQGFWLDNVSVESEPLEIEDPFVTWATGFGLTGAAADANADIENGGAGDG